MPNSFEIWPEVFDKILECFLLVDKFERGSINPVKIGEIPHSCLGGSYY